MKSCYLIEPGVAVMVTEGCSTFKPHTTREQLQFDKPVSRTATDMTFAKDNWLIRVPLQSVIYCGMQQHDRGGTVGAEDSVAPRFGGRVRLRG